jgi:hypothetical protein
MSINGYNTDPRLLQAIEKMTGATMTGCDHPEESDNAADRLWCDGYYGEMSATQTQETLAAMLPPPANKYDEIWWGEMLFAQAETAIFFDEELSIKAEKTTWRLL